MADYIPITSMALGQAQMSTDGLGGQVVQDCVQFTMTDPYNGDGPDGTVHFLVHLFTRADDANANSHDTAIKSKKLPITGTALRLYVTTDDLLAGNSPDGTWDYDPVTNPLGGQLVSLFLPNGIAQADVAFCFGVVLKEKGSGSVPGKKRHISVAARDTGGGYDVTLESVAETLGVTLGTLVGLASGEKARAGKPNRKSQSGYRPLKKTAK